MTEQKICFELVVEDNYPPTSIEWMWADKIVEQNNEFYQINNVPFFSREVSYKDIVSVELKDGLLWYKATHKPSDYSLIEVVSTEEEDKKLLKLFLSFLLTSTESINLAFENSGYSYVIATNDKAIFDKLIHYLDSMYDEDSFDYDVKFDRL